MLSSLTIRYLSFGCMLCYALPWVPAAETRIAIVPTSSQANLELTVQLATVALNDASDVHILERDQLFRVLDEHSLTVEGFVTAPQAVRIGQLLRTQLFAVLNRPTLQDSRPAHLLVFDAVSGVRLLDVTVDGETPEAMSKNVAAGVQQAVAKYRAPPGEVQTVSVLTLRNADLPRSFDATAQALGRMLESRLVQVPKLAVLERTYLQQSIRENQQISPATQPLNTSLHLLDIELHRHGKSGLSATVALNDASGGRTATLSVESDAANIVEMVESLTDQILRAVHSDAAGGSWDRATEAARFYGESHLLHEHAQYERAAASAAAAVALQPDNIPYMRVLVRRLSDAAIECVDPGMQNTPGPPRHIVERDALQHSLGFAEHALEVNREVAFRRLALDETDQLMEIALQSYLSKIAVPADQQTDATRQASASFIARVQAFELQELGNKMRQRAAASEEAFVQYTSWLSRPAMLDIFKHFRHYDSRAIDHAARLLTDWAELSRQWPALEENQRLATTQFMFSEIGWLQRESASDERSYHTLFAAYRNLQRHDEPFIKFFGLALELELNGFARRGELDETRTAVEQLTEQAIPLVPEDVASRRRQSFVHTVLQIQGLLPQQERLASHRQFYDALIAVGKYSPHTVDTILRAFQILAQPEQQIPFLDTVILQLQTQALSLTDSFRTTEIKRLNKLRDQLQPLDMPPKTPWQAVHTLVDVRTDDKQSVPQVFRAIVEPVVDQRQVFALELSFDLQAPWAEFQLQRFGLDEHTRQPLGSYRIDDLPKPDSHRAAIGNFHWVIERSTSAGSTFIRSVCLGEQTYFAATMGRGILAFPLAGGRPKQFDESHGLPSKFVQAIVYHKGFLYGWSGQPDTSAYFFRIRPDGTDAQVYASSRRATQASPLDNTKPTRCDFITIDAARDRIVFRLTDDSSHAICGLWEFAFGSGEFKHLWQTQRFDSIGKGVKRVYPDWLLVKDAASLYRFDLATNTPTKIFELDTATPWMFRPFAIVGDEIWEGAKFVRINMRTQQETPMPALREGTFQPGVFAQQITPKELLLADPAGIWLIKLK